MSRPVSLYNTASESIPPYSLVQIDDIREIVTGWWVLDGAKPTSSGVVFYPSGAIEIPAGARRSCESAFPAWVKYTGGPPANGDEWGPVDGSWLLESGGTGYTVIGVDTAKTLAYVRPTGGSSCSPQNCKLQLHVLGAPTGGTFSIDLTVNGSQETITLDYNDTAAAVKTQLETHTEIATDDVTVTEGPLPNSTIQIEFVQNLANTDIAVPTASWGSLTGGSGVGVVCSKTQLGYPNT